MSRDGDDRQAEALRKKLKLLPSSPGVYLHKDRRGRLIFRIGTKLVATQALW